MRIHGWIPILIMIGLGAGFGAFNILLSHLVGPKKPTPEKLAPYECGMPPVGDARDRHPVKFYLVAMIFLLFDIEIAFLYPWAALFRELSCEGTYDAAAGLCLGTPTLFQQLGVLPTMTGMVVAAVSAALSVKWLVAFLSRRGFAPFGWYRLALAAALWGLAAAGVVRLGG